MPNDLGFQSFDEMRSLSASPEGANRGYQSFDEMVALSSGDGDKDKEKQEERRSRPKIGAAESLRLGRQRETGDRASTLEAVGAQLTLGVQPVVDTIRTSALQQLASGKKKTFFRGEVPFSELPDYEVSNMAKFANLDMPLMDSPLKQWDKTKGAEIADPKERRAERAKFIQSEATNELKRKLQAKMEAGEELSKRDQTLWARLAGGGVENAGYTGAFMRGGVGAVLSSAARRYGDLQTDEQALIDGNVETVDKGDEQGTAMAKGAAGGSAEYAIEKYGTEVAGAVLKGTFGKIPFVGAALSKAGGTAVGKTIANVAKKFNRLGEITGKQNLAGEIMAEELPQQILDAGIGLDKRESAKLMGIGSDTAESFKSFVKPENVGNMALEMLLMQSVQGTAAGVSYYDTYSKDRNRVDGTLAAFGADPGLLKKASLQEKREVLATLGHRLTPEKATLVLERLGNKADGLYKSITEQEGYDFDAKKNGITSAFRLPAPGEGDGRERLPDGSMLYDHKESGIGIVEHPDGRATVYDRDGDMQEFKTLGEAVKSAHGLSVRNQVIDMRRGQKAKFVEATARRLSPGVKVQVHNTAEDLLEAVPEVAQSPDYSGDDMPGVAFGDTIHVVLDNIKTPRGVVSTILHEAGVHAGLNNVLKGEAKEQFLANLGAGEIDKYKSLAGKMGYLQGAHNSEEALAYMYEQRRANPTGYQRAVKWIHDQLRKVNPNYKFTEADIEVIMADAQRSVRASRGGSVTLTGEETGKAREAAEQNAYERKALEMEESYPAQSPLATYDRERGAAPVAAAGTPAVDLNAESQKRMAEDPQAWIESLRAAKGDIGKAARIYDEVRQDAAAEQAPVAAETDQSGAVRESSTDEVSKTISENQIDSQTPSPAPEVKTADVAQQTPTAKKAQAQESPNPAEADAQEVVSDKSQTYKDRVSAVAMSMLGRYGSQMSDEGAAKLKAAVEGKADVPLDVVKTWEEILRNDLEDSLSGNKAQQPRQEAPGSKADAPVPAQGDVAAKTAQAKQDAKDQPPTPPNANNIVPEAKRDAIQAEYNALYAKNYGADKREKPDADQNDIKRMVEIRNEIHDFNFKFSEAQKKFKKELTDYWAKKHGYYDGQHVEVKDRDGTWAKKTVFGADERGLVISTPKGDRVFPLEMVRPVTINGKEPWQMTQAEWDAASRFYRSGKTKQVELPTGQKVIIKNEATPTTFLEVSKDFLGKLRKDYLDAMRKRGKEIPAEAENQQPSEPAQGDKATAIVYKPNEEAKEEAQKRKTDADAKAERAGFDAAVKAKFWATGTNRLRADKAKAVKDGEELKKIGGEFETFWREEKAKADRMKAAGKVKALAEAVGMAEADTGKNEGNTPVSAPRNSLSDETASKDTVKGEKKNDNEQEVTAAEKEKYFGAKPSGPHENAIAANLAYMKSYRGEWEAMPINGMSLVDDERGFKQEMPEYDFSEYQKEGYKDAPSLYSAGNTGGDIACEWCSHPIKNVYWLVNKKRKWLMKCGSECIKDFGESTGLDIVKKVEQDKADDALRSLVRIRSGLSGAFRYTRYVGYGRTETTWGYGKGNDAAKLFEKIGKMLGQTDVKSDQAAKTRWWRKHGESITEIIQQAEALIASDEAKQSTARKARNAMVSFTAQLRRDSLAEYEKRQASKVLATLSGLHESLDAALVEAVSFTVPEGYKKTGGMYEFQSAPTAVDASGASVTVQDSLKVGKEPATAQTKNRQSIDKVEPEAKTGTPRSEKERLVPADAAPTGKQALQVQSPSAAADTAPSVSKIVSKENGREIGVSVEKVDNPVLDALRKEVEEKIARGEKVPIDTLEKFPWLAADEVIKPYVQSLVGMSDKQLQKEEKKAADELNRFADNNKAIMPDGTPNPALGNRAYFEVSNKLTAIDREIKRRSGQVIVTKKELDASKDTPNVASATPDVSPSTADAAVKVETEPGGDKTVSVPSKYKPSITPKEQKKFLLAEIDKAIVEAPDNAKAFDRTAKQDEAQSDYVSIVGENYPLGKKPTLPYNATPEDKAEHEDKMLAYETMAANKLDPLFEKYGIPEMSPERKGYLSIEGTTEGAVASSKYDIGVRYEILKARLDALRNDKYPTLTIEVPGDGEFTVINDKSHLSVFRDMAKKRFPASMFEPAANEKKALPEPHAPVRLGRTVGFDAMTAEIKALLQPFASKDQTRKPILNPHWNGAAGEAVATDGRRLAVMIGKKNAKPKKDDSGYPNYTQVVPGYKEGKVPNPDPADALAVKVDSARLTRKLIQALAVYKDVDKSAPTVKLWLTADGKVEVTTEFSETRSIKDTGGSYSSLGDTPGFELGIYNPEYLMDALTFLRKTGNATPVMRVGGKGSPMLLAGKSEYVIQMPLRMDGSGRANDTHVAEYAKWKAGQDGALDSKGRTPEQVAGLKKMAASVKEATAGGESMLPKPKQEGVADFVAAEIPQSPDGDYQIYITKVKTPDGSYVDRFAVPDRDHKNKPGFGDSLHATLEEAVKEAQNKRTRDVEEVKRNAEADDAKRKAAEAKAVEDDVDGFDAGMTPMQRGKAIQELNALVNIDGNVTTRKTFIRRAVKNGTAKPEADERDVVAEWSRTKMNRASQAEQDAYKKRREEGGKKTVYLVGGYNLGHTAFKYANHLISKASGESALPKPAAQAETTDTPKPEASAQAPTAAAQAPEEQPLPNKGVQHAIDRSLAAASIIRGKVDKKAFESAYSTLRTHSDKTGVEVPSLGTYFDAEEYRRIADTVTMGIAKKYGSFPTEELRAKRDAANASTPAKSVRIIPYKDVPSSKIKNMDAMPRGTGARYLEVTEGENGDWIAKQWRRTPVTSGNRSALLDFDAPASTAQSTGKLEDFGDKIKTKETARGVAMFRRSDAAVDAVQNDAEYLKAVERGDMETAQRMVDDAANSALKLMRERWENGNVSSFAYAKGGDITLFEIRMPKEQRGQGVGTSKMRELLELAQNYGMRVLLSPSTDFGASSKTRLEAFYRGLGFQKNSGRNKDYRTRETMIWRPEGYDKHADPVTRDDSGRIIPLSERFNTETPDIRFRRSDAEIDAARAQTGTPEFKKEYDAVVIAYKGTDKWLRAPNGEPTKLNERQWVQVRTPSFKAWFGDWEKYVNGKDGNGVWVDSDNAVSKVVDDNGEPLVVFHGTTKFGFTEIDPYKADKHRSPMVFASNHYGTARSYSDGGYIEHVKSLEEEVTDEVKQYASDQYGWEWESDEERDAMWDGLSETQKFDAIANYRSENGEEDMGRGVYPLFLNIREPLESDFEGRNWDGASNGLFQVTNEEGEVQYDDSGKGVFTDDEAEAFAEALSEKTGDSYKWDEAEGGETTNSVAEEALRFKNDGAIIRNVLDDGGRGGSADVSDVYVFFKAGQAKSALDNTGEFGSSNDIRFRRSDAAVDAALGRGYTGGVNVDTPEFKKWFGDSKVVDKDGKPLVVYHGSPVGGIAKFNDSEDGIAFTSKRKVAEGYTWNRGIWRKPSKTGTVYQAFLSLNNPLIIDAYGKRNDNIPVPWQDWKPKVYGNLPNNAVNLSKVAEYAKANGHDGFIVRNVIDTADIEDRTSSDVYVVFSSSQVKLDIAGKDIRMRRSDAEIDAAMAEIEREDVAENFRALPSTNTNARDMQADVQVSYAYNLEPKTVQQMQDNARGIYERDKKKAQLDLLAGYKDKDSDDINTDAQRMATDKLAVDDMTMDAVNSPDDDGKAATAMLAIWRWYERGTDVARALRMRFDPADTPEGRRAWIMRTLLAPTRAEAEIIRRAKTTNEAISALKAKAKHARASLKILRAKNIDISKLTADQLMDEVYVAKIMQDISAARSGWGDVVHEWWRNAILSAPTTPLVNTVGNAGNAALEAFVQRPVEALINTYFKNDRAATFRSIGAMYRAIIPSMRAANKNFLKAWATEKPVTGDSAKVEESSAAIPSASLNLFGKEVEVGGKQVRIPQRIMLATDEWFKTVFMAMLTADYATREFDRLVTEGKQSESNRDAYVRAQVDPGSSAYAKAWEETLRWSFQQKPVHMAGAIMNWRDDPDFGFWLKFIFPFVRTPANIISSGLRKTPLNAIPYVYKAATGKYSQEDAFRLGAEQAVGMAFMAVLYAMMKGDDDDPLDRPRITGTRKASAFSPKGMKEAEMKDYPPMSVRVGDRWVSYKRLEPFATMASTMVDALTVWEQAKAGHAEDIPATVFSSIRGNLADKTFLQGVGNLVSIMEGDELAMSRAVTGTLAGFNPNIVRSTVRAFDPYIRETRTQEKGALKKFASRLAYQAYPAESNAPPPKIGKDGNPVEREGGGVYNSIVPFSVQAADKTTKADAMVKRYNERVPKEQRWWPSSPEPSDVTFGREKIRMTDEENAEYKRVAGQIAERRLSSISFNYSNPGERDIDRLKKVYEKSREAARDRMRPAVIRRWKAGRSGGEAEA